jgi:hypothetical protein
MISNKYNNLCINEEELLKECIQKNNETQCEYLKNIYKNCMEFKTQKIKQLDKNRKKKLE